jgi:anaerobic selenocysteine-containing dehydrogenase
MIGVWRAVRRRPAAIAYGRLGTCVTQLGATTCWLIDVLNAVTGNLDRQGGVMFSSSAVDLAGLAARSARAAATTGGAAESRACRNGQRASGRCATAEIETPGKVRSARW